MRSTKIGKVEISYIPPKKSKKEKLESTLEYYKEVGVWIGVAMGLAQVIGGLK